MTSLKIGWEMRPAIYRPNKYRAAALGLEEGASIHVDVFGLFQYKIDDDMDAAFVIELPDGTCNYAAVTEITFVDKGGCPNADNCN